MASPLDRIESETSEVVAHADVCVDGRLLADYHEAIERLSTLTPNTAMLEDTDQDGLRSRIQELHDRVQERTHRYTFRCIDRATRSGLADRYPPSDKDTDRGYEYDPDGFEPALAGHALVEVDGEPVDLPVGRRIEHFEMLRSQLPQGKHGWGEIWSAVLVSNDEGTQVPKSVSGIVGQFVSELNLTMPQAAV